MLKKAMPLFLMSGLVLGACGMNNGVVPKKNETPMENVEDRERDWTPNVRDERQGGTDLDGIDIDRDRNGVRNGIINDGTNTPNDGGVNDVNPNPPTDVIIEEEVTPNNNRINR